MKWNLQGNGVKVWNFIITQLIATQAESFLPGSITLSPRCRLPLGCKNRTTGVLEWHDLWRQALSNSLDKYVCLNCVAFGMFLYETAKETSKTSTATVYKRLLSCLLHTWEANYFKWFSLTNELWWFEHLENTIDINCTALCRYISFLHPWRVWFWKDSKCMWTPQFLKIQMCCV